MQQHALQFIEISLLKRHITLDFFQCISVSIMTTCGYVSCVRPGLSLAAACCILSTVLQKPWASLGQEDCLPGKQHRDGETLKRDLGSQPACNMTSVTKMSIMTPNITWQDPWPSTHHPSLCLLLQTCRGQINVIKYYEISLDQKVIYLLLIDIYNLKFSAVVGAGTSLEFGSGCRSVVEFRGVDAKGT